MDALNLRADCAMTVTGWVRILVTVAAFLSLGAGYRTENFIVSAPTPALARQLGDAAERYREELAQEWLGQALPRWAQPCPIRAEIRSGAGGATSFTFRQGVPGDWRMEIQGSPERMLDSVLPHEVTHTIFATHFGRPLPRWADEGACTTVEHPSERDRQNEMLERFLRVEPPRTIPFNQMYRMKEYPHDIMPLYAQGHSVARFLLHQGGKRKFVDYVGRGMQTEDWDHTTRDFYGYRDLSELQLAWVDWVAKGSPKFGGDSTALASRAAAIPSPSTLTITSPLPPLLRPTDKEMDSVRNAMDRESIAGKSWYSRVRDDQPPQTVQPAPDRDSRTLSPAARALQQPPIRLTPRSLLPQPTYGPAPPPTRLQWRNVPAAERRADRPVYFDSPASPTLLR